MFSTSFTVENFYWGFQGLEEILINYFKYIYTVINISAMFKNKYRSKILFLSSNLHMFSDVSPSTLVFWNNLFFKFLDVVVVFRLIVLVDP